MMQIGESRKGHLELLMFPYVPFCFNVDVLLTSVLFSTFDKVKKVICIYHFLLLCQNSGKQTRKSRAVITITDDY